MNIYGSCSYVGNLLDGVIQMENSIQYANGVCV